MLAIGSIKSMTKMADESEDVDLAALKMAVLATMRNKSERAKAEENNLRKTAQNVPQQPVAAQESFLRHQGYMNSMGPRQRGHGRGRSRGRGWGRGRGMGMGMGMGTGGRGMGTGHNGPIGGRGTRGGRTNLIVLTAPPEPPPSSFKEASSRSHIKQEKPLDGSKPLLLLPQDKWAPSPTSAGESEIESTKSKPTTKFDRFESDSDSDDDEDDIHGGSEVDGKSEGSAVELNTYSDDSDSDDSAGNPETVCVVTKADSAPSSPSRDSSPDVRVESPEQSPERLTPAENSPEVESDKEPSTRASVSSPSPSESSQSSSSISPIRSKSPSPAPVAPEIEERRLDSGRPSESRPQQSEKNRLIKRSHSPEEAPRSSRERPSPFVDSGDSKESHQTREHPVKRARYDDRVSEHSSKSSRGRESPTHDIFDEFDARNYRTREERMQSTSDSSKNRKEYPADKPSRDETRHRPFASYEENRINRKDSGAMPTKQVDTVNRGGHRSEYQAREVAPTERPKVRDNPSKLTSSLNSERESGTSRYDEPKREEERMDRSSSSDSESVASKSVSPAARVLEDSDSDDSMKRPGKTVSERRNDDIEVERRKRTLVEIERERNQRRELREKERQSHRTYLDRTSEAAPSNRRLPPRNISRERERYKPRIDDRDKRPSSSIRTVDDIRSSNQNIVKRSPSPSPPRRSVVSVVTVNPKPAEETTVVNSKPKKVKRKKKKRDKANQSEPKRIIVKNDSPDRKESVFKRLNMKEDTDRANENSSPRINVTFDSADRLPVHQRLGMPVQARSGSKERVEKKLGVQEGTVRVVRKEQSPNADLRNILDRKTGSKNREVDHHNGGGERKLETSSSSKRIKLNRKGGSGDASSSGYQPSISGEPIGVESQLDQKIRKIQEKNEAILKRKREIEADKQRYAT